MTISNWITIGATIVSVAFGSGVILAKMGAKMDSFEKELKHIRKDVRKRIERLEKKAGI